MHDMPVDLKAKLDDRIREQMASEVRGDVQALYEFTLPAIRAKRIAERDDEPMLSLSEIEEFVAHVHEAEVRSIHIEEFWPSSKRSPGCPAALVVTKIRYNGLNDAGESRCIWVYSEDTWFTTSLGKMWLGGR
jgi:hypothetical protein